MRALAVGLVGSILLIGGLVAGVSGLGLQIMNPCTPTYKLSLQPADSVTTTPDQTVTFESLSEYQRTAVQAAVENDTRLTFQNRERLAPLTEAVITMDDNRYVAEIIENPCQSLYDELAISGFAGAIVGALVSLYALAVWRFS